ncbi:HlyD family secretion protein [Thalassotalea nanhaiensis]|uniref:HlyD family secretion protein n=1 Tax=Thalassotalea nanhaiensis TaxID=3065648 RepID=A0ABY9TH23_9GAMM|nr:HlyD family secretion protein [Colwelliaceae bacterium SQ345]
MTDTNVVKKEANEKLDGSETTNEDVNETTNETAKPDFAQRLSKIILSLALLYFLWYVIGDRLTPISDQARVRAFVIPIVPQVSGQITNIYVGGDKIVKKDDVLFEIDNRDFKFALDKAKASLELTGQEIGADTAMVGSAKASLDQANADLIVKRINANRVFELEKQGIISGFDGDRARGVLTQAELEVVNAQASYEEAQQKLGKQGENNPKLLSALAEVSTAQLNLDRTIIKAPNDGVISYAKVNVGYYAAQGSKIMTFISNQYVWIEASFRENSLGNLKSGDPVDIVLDSAPGQVFAGEVITIGFGVSFDKSQPGDLPTPEKPQGWMRDPQRFTTIIKFTDEPDKRLLREGGQADVIAYTGDSFIFNTLGKIWVRITSFLTYLY